MRQIEALQSDKRSLHSKIHSLQEELEGVDARIECERRESAKSESTRVEARKEQEISIIQAKNERLQTSLGELRTELQQVYLIELQLGCFAFGSIQCMFLYAFFKGVRMFGNAVGRIACSSSSYLMEGQA